MDGATDTVGLTGTFSLPAPESVDTMPPVARAHGRFFHLFKIVKRRTGGSGLFCVRFRLGGNRLFDNRRRHVGRFSRYRLRLINRSVGPAASVVRHRRLPLVAVFLRRKRVIFPLRSLASRRIAARKRQAQVAAAGALAPLLSILRMRLIILRRRCR